MDGPASDPELSQALGLLDRTQELIRTIFLGLSLQYKSFDLQRRQLLAQAEGAPWQGRDPREVQSAASLITLCALFGFQKQTEDLARQEALAGGCPDMTDVKLGAAIILVALIRLVRLQKRLQAGSREETLSEQEAALEEDLDEGEGS